MRCSAGARITGIFPEYRANPILLNRYWSPEMSMYRLIAVLILAIYLLSPGMIKFWDNIEHPWYSPFLAWLVLIALTAWFGLKRSRDEL